MSTFYLIVIQHWIVELLCMFYLHVSAYDCGSSYCLPANAPSLTLNWNDACLYFSLWFFSRFHILCTFIILLVIMTLVIALLQYFFFYYFAWEMIVQILLSSCVKIGTALSNIHKISKMAVPLQENHCPWFIIGGVLTHHNCLKVYSQKYHLYSHDRFMIKTIYDRTLAQKSLSNGSWQLQFL